MMLGIAGGIMFAGLLFGALTGSVWVLISCAAAGLLIAGVTEAATSYKEQAAASRRLAQYPPYGY